MDYLNLKQIAEKLKVSVITVRRYIKSGKLNAKRIGRDYRISDDDLNNFFNEPNKKLHHISKEFKIGDIKIDGHRTKSISIFPGLNFHVMETLAEMSPSISSINEIRDIISKHDHIYLENLKQIETNDTRNPPTIITLLLIDDAINNLKTRRRLFKNLIDKKGIILLPLPPHLSDSLLRLVSRNMIFLSDRVLPPHLKDANYDDIEYISIPELTDRAINIELLVAEGYVENKEIYLRRSVVNTIYSLLSNGLKEIYIHNIPHIPPHSKFIKFNKKIIDVKVSMI